MIAKTVVDGLWSRQWNKRLALLANGIIPRSCFGPKNVLHVVSILCFSDHVVLGTDVGFQTRNLLLEFLNIYM
jgi:hypothetical protein